MHKININKTIVIVGLMGCGKSAVGKRLSQKINRPFHDVDVFIEKNEGLTVSAIFEKHGEPYFRELEQNAVAKLLEDNNQVIATGGGTFMQPKTRKLILENSVTIWIRASLEILLDRVSRKNTRPLLEKGDKSKILQDLMNQRYPIYEQADIIVDTSEAPHNVIVEEIINRLNEYEKQL